LYNALQSQLDAKKQAYDVYHETVTQPVFHELITEIRKYITSIVPIDDSNELVLNSRSLCIKLEENDYYSNIELYLNKSWSDGTQYIKLDWRGGDYNLTDRSNKLQYINVMYILANNLKSIEDIWINDWKVKYDSIWDADNNIKKEHDDLQTALSNLKYEIKTDLAESMKQIGFEIKQFKPDHSLDWDYDKDNSSKRVYKIDTRSHQIKMQHGRSQYDTCYVSGFKILGKKGNKYNVEVYRDNSPNRTYDVLEKKFESFIEDVSRWEYEESNRRSEKAKRDYEERTKNSF